MILPKPVPSPRPQDLSGATVGRFCIHSLLGAGGSGEVYRAEDTVLKRPVALKRVATKFRAERHARERILKEAQRACILDSEYIARVYDVVEEEGEVFLVMEFVEGHTLRHELKSKGSLPLDSFLGLAVQCAEALAAAHQKGIVHRDIKPENIMLTPSAHVKILDFGLARHVPLGDCSTATTSSESRQEIAGTPGYMAPEVLVQPDLDSRADVFSLGVTFYEMLTGRHPFVARKLAGTTHAIEHQMSAPLRKFVPGAPAELKRILSKMLASDPAERYPTAADLVVDLRALQRVMKPARSLTGPSWRGAARWIIAGLALSAVALFGFWKLRQRPSVAPHSTISSVAVLPLENLSGDPEQEYFTDGMTEELISRLARIGALRVISRTSVMRYKDTKETLPEIARELNVDAILEGSVLRSGNRVRISAQLIRARSDEHLWAESYERDLRDVLALQSDVAKSVANSIRIEVTPREAGRLDSSRAVNGETYQLYLKGRYYWNKRNPDALNKSLEYFEQAIGKDPDYAPAYAGLADAYRLLGQFAVLPYKVSIAKAKGAAQTALQLDDNLAEAHASLGMASLMDHFDWRQADHQLLTAIEMNPGYASAYQWRAMALASTGRVEEGVQMARKAQELDPLSLIINAYLGFAYYQSRDYEGAIDQCRKTIELDPNFAVAHSFLSLAYAQKGVRDLAVEEARKGVDLSGGAANLKAILAAVYAAAGKRSNAQQIAAGLAKSAHDGYLNPEEIALIYAQLGNKDRAFQWLNTAYEEGSIWTAFLKSEPVLDGLRSDPRFARLLTEVGLPD